MRDFTYRRADSIDEAIAGVAAGATPIAGGTELLNWMRLGADQSGAVIDIGDVDALRGISLRGGVVRIGSLATLNEIEGDATVREHAPVLAKACLESASAQIRNSATLGGNLLQKTRCPYFRVEAGNETRLPWACNKRQVGSGCSAATGLNDHASIFGTTDACRCNHPSDPAAALATLDATVHVTGPDGERDIPASEFHLSQAEARDLLSSGQADGLKGAWAIGKAGAEAVLLNRMRGDEIITGYSFSVDAASANSVYLKVRERKSFEYAKVSAAVCLEARDGRIQALRVAMGSIAQRPWRLRAAEAKLAGAVLTSDALTPVLDEEFASARPASSQEYKVRLARNAARRAILLAGGKSHA
ncbi:MAG: xanthine dehydrogenase family protein subunit M [Boseongicola sp. SB0670_bin_30]|nr:xanthine dehydrogenase family protein subunit M [Boseongicola sp. SB0670_bin_30]